MKKMRWSEYQTCQFVKLYLSNECLWNPQHPLYKQRGARDKALYAIIADFSEMTNINLVEGELKLKIRNLKSTYSQELSKILSRSKPGYPYKSSMKWFADWHRCFKHLSRKKIDDVSNDPNENDSTTDMCFKDWEAEEINTNEVKIPDLFTKPEDVIIVNVQPKNNQNENDSHENYKEIFTNKNSIKEYFNRSHRSSVDSNTNTKEDEFDCYGRFIASQLRNMDLQKALTVQLEIQSLVSEARISEMLI